jgi:hypothetical protein
MLPEFASVWKLKRKSGGFSTKLNVGLAQRAARHGGIGNVPMGVAPVVLIVSWLEHVGLYAPGLNPATAPAGSPEAEKEMLWRSPRPGWR